MTRIALALLVFAATLIGSPLSALAQERELIGTFRDWNTFREIDGGNTLCYAVAIPDEAQLSRRGRQRGEIFFFVNTWKELGLSNQVNIALGYPVDPEATHMLRIGNEAFELFGQEEWAFLMDEGETGRLLGAMRRGSDMLVSARSTRGTESTDSYSLFGATDALQAASEACN